MERLRAYSLIHGIILVFLIQFISSDDRIALLSFKSMILDDPLGALNSWNNDTLHYCRWKGVTCGRRHPERVTALALDSLDLNGTISPSVANLTFLRRLHLSDNRLHGPIPQDLGRLSRLQQLNLSMNSLGGELPASLSQCSKLQYITLGYNNLQGKILSNLSNCRDLEILDLRSNKIQGGVPEELGSLRKLTTLRLDSNKLTGGIPPSLGNLSSIIYLFLSENSLSGEIPPTLGSLSSVEYLVLSENSLTGEIPSSLGELPSISRLGLSTNSLSGGIPPSLWNLSSLQIIHLSNNTLSGSIPASFEKLRALTDLYLGTNALSGRIPPSVANISTLNYLELKKNALSGEIPTDLGELKSLMGLDLCYNQLSGFVPPSLYNLSMIHFFAVCYNELVGTIPSDIALTLPLLQYLYMLMNHFHGTIPLSLPNATALIDIELNNNNLTGTIPSNLGNLPNLEWLDISNNQLEAKEPDQWSFLAALSNCSNLQVLELAQSRLVGTLPSSIANLSTDLVILTFGHNQLTGSIPDEIGNLVNLTMLHIGPNLFTGPIPTGIGKIRNLQELSMSGNKLSGQIPATLGNLSQMDRLYLDHNDLVGSIPSSFGNFKNLEQLNLSYNRLSGDIPKEVVSLSSLSTYLDLSHNLFIGALPPEVGSLINLQELDVSENNLTGDIPKTLADCQILEILYLEGNRLQGVIPPSFSKLRGLQELDLSCNNLSGNIPEFLGSLRLNNLNLSFNNFEGEVPTEGIFKNMNTSSILGNNELCGGMPELKLPACRSQNHGSRWKSPAAIAAEILVPLTVLCFILLLLFLFRNQVTKSKNKTNHESSTAAEHMRVSYGDLVRATDGFSSQNLVGTGSFGAVYQGIMDYDGDQKAVAVKVLNLQTQGASKSFIAECEALRSIRHRNLVKILTSFSSTDYNGNDFKALVFEFMPNGSLERWLHPALDDQEPPINLSLIQRLNIAIDVASALEYLHHHAPTQIVHRDIKPSNVLLDMDMTAHLSDFGLAKFLMEESNKSSTSMVGLKGSIGYVAPEYGMGSPCSVEGDVYSYGILILEMFTGKRPVDSIFDDGMSLNKYVQVAYPERVMDIIDTRILLQEENFEANGNTRNTAGLRDRTQGCLASVIRLGLLCSKESPRERMDMRDVTMEMIVTRNIYLSIKMI